MHIHWCLIVDTPIKFTQYKKATGSPVFNKNGRCQRKRESADERGNPERTRWRKRERKRKTSRRGRTSTKKKTTKSV